MNHLLRVRTRRALALGFAAAAGLILPASAAAAAPPAAENIPITSFKAGPVAPFNLLSGLPVTADAPTDPTKNDVGCMHVNPAAPILSTAVAGQNADYCITFSVNPGDAIIGDDINNTVVQLPVGTQGDIDLAAKCTEEQFARESVAPNSCPGAAQVGTALVQLQVPDNSAGKNPAVDRTVKQAPGRIYALTTPGDKAALLGVALIASAPSAEAPTTPVTESKFKITVSQLGDPSIGLINQTDELARVLGGTAPIAIQATSLRFWGSAAAHPHVANPFAPAAPVTMVSNFFRVGSTCQTDQAVKLTVNPYNDVNTTIKPSEATTSYKLAGCDALPFSPAFSAGLSGEMNPGGHPQLDVAIVSPPGDEDLGATKITLPAGVATDLTRIQNACPQATFQAGGCPESAVVGAARATLSGIGADVISGDVVMVKVAGRQLPGIGLNFKGRLPLRVFGITEVDANGRLVNTFAGLPSLPERSLNITLFGGARGILQTDPSGKCTASSYDATIVGQNGKSKSFSSPTTCAEQFHATLSNSSKTRPVLLLGEAAPTGKTIKSIRVGLPKGLRFDAKNLRNKKKVTYAERGFDQGFDTKKTRVAKVKAKGKWTFTGKGSNGFSILTHTGVLRASKSFAKSDKKVYVQFRVVYSDGTKVTKYVALTRAG